MHGRFSILGARTRAAPQVYRLRLYLLRHWLGLLIYPTFIFMSVCGWVDSTGCTTKGGRKQFTLDHRVRASGWRAWTTQRPVQSRRKRCWGRPSSTRLSFASMQPLDKDVIDTCWGCSAPPGNLAWTFQRYSGTRYDLAGEGELAEFDDFDRNLPFMEIFWAFTILLTKVA